MKTTLDLPDEVVRAVKLNAVIQGRTVKDLVAEYLRQGLGMAPLGQPKPRPTSARVEVKDNGLPVVRCHPKAPAALMNVGDLLKLEAEIQSEEDLKRAGLAH
jgi:hypothetical protein